MKQKEAWELAAGPQLKTKGILLGPLASYSLLKDPKHISFLFARYKICSKLLEDKDTILEIGCGDAIGSIIVAKNKKRFLAIDNEKRLIDGNIDRLNMFKNIEFKYIDIIKEKIPEKFDGAFCIDVIEHLDHENEKLFMKNIINSLKEHSIFIIGTPNIYAKKYATKKSSLHHINLKSKKTLKGLMNKYFENVIIFYMNDETFHLGYEKMGHYLVGVGFGLR